MAVKAVALATLVRPGTNAGTFKLNIKIVGLDTTVADDTVVLDNVAPGIATATLEQEIKTAVKDYLIANYSYTFGLLDSVRLIGAVL